MSTPASRWPFPSFTPATSPAPKAKVNTKASASATEGKFKGWSVDINYQVYRGEEGSIRRGKILAHGLKTKKLAAERGLSLLAKGRAELEEKLKKLAAAEAALQQVVADETIRESAEKAARGKVG